MNLPVISICAAGLLLSVSTAARAVTVGGDSVCPSPAEVSNRVNALLPSDAPGAALFPRVDQVGSALRVRLADDHGAVVAERALPAEGSCSEMAELAAVTITTWLTELQSAPVSDPDLPVTPRTQTAPTSRGKFAFDLGGGALVSSARGGPALGFSALLTAHTDKQGPGLFVRGSVGYDNEVQVGNRTASWHRRAIAAGPSYQLALGSWRVGGGVAFSAGWITAEGKNFARNLEETRFSPGVEGLVRIARPFRFWSPWIALGGIVAFRDETLNVVGSTETGRLSPAELSLGVGISFGRFP